MVNCTICKPSKGVPWPKPLLVAAPEDESGRAAWAKAIETELNLHKSLLGSDYKRNPHGFGGWN